MSDKTVIPFIASILDFQKAFPWKYGLGPQEHHMHKLWGSDTRVKKASLPTQWLHHSLVHNTTLTQDSPEIFGADIRKISHLITQHPDITICNNNTATLKHQMSLVTCWKSFTREPLCGWWHRGDPSSTVGVSHLWARALLLAQPQEKCELLPSSFDLSMEQVHSCPVKSHTQTPSAYQDLSTCLWQLQNKPQKCFFLCW